MRRTGSILAKAIAGTALALGLLVPLAAPAAADGGATVGLAAAPAKQGQLDGRTRFSLAARPGRQLDDQLLVRNTGSTDQRLRVYATDAFDTADGAFALLDGVAAPTGAGTWVGFDDGTRDTSLTLAAGAQALVPFTVKVPTGATPGDHAGGIVVSVASTNGSLTVDRRLATRLYVRVQGNVQPALTVRSVTASQPTGGNPFAAPTTVTAVVTNTGDVALTARAEVSVRTWFGRPVGASTSRDVAELLPGATRTLTFDLGSVGRVGYLAPQLTLTPAADPDTYGFTLPRVLGSGAAPAVPWLLLVVLLAAVAATLLVLRRRGRAATEPEPAEQTPAPAAAVGGRA